MAGAAQAAIFDQTSAAQGDFARTSGGLANQQRILAAQVENLKARLGQALLPVVQRLVTFINTTVIPVLSAWAEKYGPAVERACNRRCWCRRALRWLSLRVRRPNTFRR